MDLGRILYLMLALAGLAFPVRRFVAWFGEHGADWQALAEAVTVNGLARGITGALIIVSIATIVFIVAECWARRDRLSLVAVPATIILGPAVGLPLYLYLRLRPVG